MGSPEVSVPFLDFLVSQNVETIVFTQPDKIRKRGRKLEPTPVKKKAVELGLNVYTQSAKSVEAYEIIKDFKPEIILVVAYGQILPKRILDCASLYPLNVHFSLLPKYRGATPVNSALLNGDAETGTTIMIMDEGLDTGDVIFSRKCAIDFNENATELFDKLVKISTELLKTNWKEICSGDVVKTPQTGEATYTSLIKKEDMMLDFTDDGLKIFNKIKAFNYSYGTRSTFRNNPLIVERAEYVCECSGTPGEIITVSKEGITVCCAKGGIKITELKPAGKKSMKASDFINGYKPVSGERFL